MITRIVRMHFRSEASTDFQSIFEASKELIRAFDGCLYLSLHQDAQDPSVFYTLSRWQSENHLNNYRQSDLFKSTWAKTKVLFQEKAQAYSLKELVVLK